MLQYRFDCRFDSHLGGIEQHRVGSRFERRHGTFCITRIPCLHIADKGR
jgi:hypothetical protein